jgi:hypothetical protein
MGRKVKYLGRTYQKRAIELMGDFGPHFQPCGTCGSPCVHGYVCQYCTDDDGGDSRYDALTLVEVLGK